MSQLYNITKEFIDLIKLPDSSCKRLNYLIIMPKQAEKGFQYIFPTGMGIVTSSLKASGRTVYTLNLTYKDDICKEIENKIIEHNIDVVMTGGLSGQYGAIYEILKIVKTISADIITAVGGGIITADPLVAMTALEYADYGMIGEGEITINALAYSLETGGDVSKVEGVIINGNKEYILRSEIKNIDCIPFPDYEGFEYELSFNQNYSKTALQKEAGAVIITSRSCPYNCTFCFHSSGKRYRRRSLDTVFKEIDMMVRMFRFDYLQINDELFGNDINYVREFAQRIKKYNIRYYINTRLDRITDELLTILRDSGCTDILFGIEHISDKILTSMQKKTTSSIIEPTLRKCVSYGIRPIGNIIFGDVAETKETVNEALEWWRYYHNELGTITTTYLIVFPGSAIYKNAIERHIIKDPVRFLKDGCPLVNMTLMPDEEWQELKRKVANYRILYEKTPSIDEEKVRKNLMHMLNMHHVAIWPATADIISFFEQLIPGFQEKAVYINIDPNSQMLDSSNIKVKIYTPDVISLRNTDVVICARETLADDIKKLCLNKYQSVKSVITISQLSILNLEDI